MSINDVLLFGTLVEDVVPRKNRVGQPFATFRVKTYKQVLDRLSGQTKEHTDVHEVQCLEPDTVARLGVHGKAGAWVRVRGEIAYKDSRMFVRVPVLGGMAVVSPYFGTDITPSHPHKSAGDPGSDAVRQAEISETVVSVQDGHTQTTAASAPPEPSDVDGSPESTEAVSAGPEAEIETTALDELHADAGVSPETKEEPPTGAPRAPVPGLRRPVAAPSGAQTSPSAPVPASSSAPSVASPPPTSRPSAPSLPRSPAGLPGRPLGGMPRPTAAPAAATPGRSSFSRPAAPPQPTVRPGPSSPPVKSKVLTADDIPF